MDKYTKLTLTVIAVGVTLIAIKLYLPQATPVYPTRGDLQALRLLTNPQQRSSSLTNILAHIPLVWVQDGSIDATVSGSVSIDR